MDIVCGSTECVIWLYRRVVHWRGKKFVVCEPPGNYRGRLTVTFPEQGAT